MKCVSCGCLGTYMFRMSIGARGLLLIIIAWRYGGIELEVEILMFFCFCLLIWVSWLVWLI